AGIDPHDFAKRCRIDVKDPPVTCEAAQIAMDSCSTGDVQCAVQQSLLLRASLQRYVLCGRYVDRSGIEADALAEPVAPQEPSGESTSLQD
ncbi:unnamed protein product, partial [Polarella glacialis]